MMMIMMEMVEGMMNWMGATLDPQRSRRIVRQLIIEGYQLVCNIPV